MDVPLVFLVCSNHALANPASDHFLVILLPDSQLIMLKMTLQTGLVTWQQGRSSGCQVKIRTQKHRNDGTYWGHFRYLDETVVSFLGDWILSLKETDLQLESTWGVWWVERWLQADRFVS